MPATRFPPKWLPLSIGNEKILTKTKLCDDFLS